ncbi:MAG: hypothetical protein V1684_01640 [bacterium]
MIQIGFLSAWPPPAGNFNLALCLVIFMAVVLDSRLAFWYALGLGVGLEIFSLYPYGLILAGLILVVFLINWLFSHFFTNRSFYSLMALGLVGVNFYYAWLLTGGTLAYLLKIISVGPELNRFYLLNLLWQNVLQLILLAAAFLILNLTSRKLKTVFLIEE